MSAQFIKLRLFLEGVECPVISASVTQALREPARASIEVPADPAVNQLSPRTMVHLFVYQPHLATKTTSEDDHYVLLFSGDLMSIAYNKTSFSRSATLICEDDSSYYDSAHAYFVSENDLNGNTENPVQAITRERANFVGASSGFVAPAEGVGVLQQIIERCFGDPHPVSYGFSEADGLYGAVLKMIEMFMGVDDLRRLGANQFFSFHAHRKRLLMQLGVLPKDKTASLLLQAKHMTDFIGKRADQLGQLITLRQLITYILDFMYYHLVPCASPYAVPSKKRTVTGVDVQLQDQIARISQLITLVETDSEKFNERHAEYITIYTTSPGEEKSFLQFTLEKLDREFKTKKTTIIDASRVYTTFVIPDLFFAVPPTCNVLYPDMYTSFSINQSLSRDPTRFHLTAAVGAALGVGVGTGDLVYYAPSVEGFSSIQGRSYSEALGDRDTLPESSIVRGGLFDHELHTGVIPAFSRIDRLSFSLAQSSAERSTLENNPVLQRSDFYTRIANGQYIKKRIEQRRASASGVLNPFAAVGFPMVLIDGYATPKGDLYASSEDNEHYVGMLSSLIHNVSQEGGSTTYELGSVRAHRGERDKFLSELSLEANGASVPLEEAIRPRYVDDIYASPTIGENVYKNLLGVSSVVDAYKASATKQKKRLYTFNVGPGFSAKTPYKAHSLEDVIDVIAASYVSTRGAESSQKKVARPIATLSTMLGHGGFHDLAWRSNETSKVLPLLANVVYDTDKGACPPGYRPATQNEIGDAKKRINPNLDVRYERHKRVLKYIKSTQNRGRFG
jgi:hypothetical protein